ncbi:hypothetical protein OEZ85_002267 [Tetradesmus obliquus]|uniref:cellulase n=1 Tax=Tetradesmus obliquus TaxID=3088 RepID=A0ABY8U2Q8_TETOB|nr:hypothetical protein OEZ85_002267 [Tetradesmus obliquus]
MLPKQRLLMEQQEVYGKLPLPQPIKEPIYALNERKPPRPDPVIVKRWSWSGLAIFLYFIAAAVYYFIIRGTRTLNIGYTSYGQLVLAIEVISATATLSYGILLTRYTQPKAVKGLPVADEASPLDPDDIQFQVHVLICCYGEDDGVVGNTVEKTLLAKLPAKTKRTIYLCDDKGEESKANIVKRLSERYSDSRTELRYITGRVRVADGRTAREVNGRVREVNGKSNNLNNCLKNVIYPGFTDPKNQTIPDNEIMMVLDADQAPVESFFCRVLEVMADKDIALCLTPQNFDDVKASYDIFNCLNLSFWEYMLPGTDAVEYIACTGTNFGLRCDALFKCGWFPTWSVTEDYTLGMNLKAKGYKARYLNEYLVFGTSPETVRKVFQQRSRWCKGQMQVLFSKECPLLDTGLTLDMRLLYTSVTWSYITNMLAVPCSVLVPFIALVFGVYPLVLNRDFALAATLYYTSSTMVTMYARRWEHLKPYARRWEHLKPVWFCIVSCHLLWFTFTKAVINVSIIAPLTGKMLGFKVTGAKNAAAAANGADSKPKRRICSGGCFSWLKPKYLGDMAGTWDHYVLLVSFLLSFITAAVGIFGIIDKPYTAQGEVRWFLLLSVFWAIHNMIPPALFLRYIYMDVDPPAAEGDDPKPKQKSLELFEDFCSFAFALSFAMAVGGVACTWLVPDDYNLGQVLNVSLQFFEAQRSGKLPRISNTPWRGNSGVWDSVLLPNGKNYSLLGGWYDDGGMLKLTYPTAFTVSLLSWAYWEFKQGYAASDNLEFGANTIRWGADYLNTVAITNITSSSGTVQPIFVAQVGDITRDRAYWGQPERSTIPRPASFLSQARPGTDAMAMTAAGLAAAAVAVQGDSLQVAQKYLAKAQLLYTYAQRWRGLYAKFIDSGKLYPSVSMHDDLAYAAVWLYIGTGQQKYLSEAIAFYGKSVASEGHVSSNPYQWNYENVIPALDLLLAQVTGEATYKANVAVFVNKWMNSQQQRDAGSSEVFYTRKGLAKASPDGTLQHTANAAFYTLLAAKTVLKGNYMLYACWARNQIGYMLGDAGRSYVTGYGAVQPRKAPHKAASCPPADISDCTWETAYYTTDPNFHTLRGGLVGGPDDNDAWVDDRDMNNPANTVSLLNSAGFSAAVAGLVADDINMAKCQQGNGFIQTVLLKAKGLPDAAGQRWWEGVQ